MDPVRAGEFRTSTTSGSNSAAGGSGPNLLDVIADVIARRANGETLLDSQIVAAYPHLMPALADELKSLREIRRAQAMANVAGPDEQPIEVLSASRLDEPITADTGPEAADPRAPTIRGYQLLGEISSGGQATVYKAIQESTGRTVAIKVLFGGPFLNSRGRSRFERESAVLASLNHPHIVRIVDRGRTTDGSFYLVMDYIDGPPLDEMLARRRGQLEDLLNLFVKLADAVQEAHAQGIVHRDLKPSNVRIDARGEPHLLDFGLARLLEGGDDPELLRTLTITGRVIGSLPWSSPEQASGAVHEVDARSDVYSLGVMLYELLTGVPPYPVGGLITETLVNIRTASPKAFTKIRNPRYRGLDGKLEAIVFKALCKSPEGRYGSAGQLGQDLRQYLAGKPIVAKSRSSQRRRWPWVVLGGCLAAVFGWVGYAMYASHSPPDVVQLPSQTNSTGMKFVLIPKGQFAMGSSLQELGRGRDEREHRVQLNRSYYLSVTEITRGQYRIVGSVPGGSGSDDWPVDGVSWEEATEFCKLLGRREPGCTYRLPTEAEWEYACRAGSSTPYAGTNRLDEMGWYQDNAGGHLHPVAHKYPNIWGVYDMHGGVAEWCSDRYEDPYPTRGGVDPSGAEEGFHRCVRGGSVTQPAEECRSAARGAQSPDAHLPAVGFRVVLEAPATESNPRP